MDMVSINGKFNQTISPMDRGLLFGESVFEVIPVYNKQPFYLDVHLDRLEEGYKFFSQKPLPIKDIRKWIKQYINHAPMLDFDNIYIQITTGQMIMRDHKPDAELKPNVIIHRTLMHPVNLKRYQQGFKATCVPDTRSNYSGVKSNHLATNTMALGRAIDNGFDTGIFIKNNCIKEGVASNFFAVKNGTLITPPIDGILAGITRQIVLEIADRHNIPYEITPIPLLSVSNMDEIFLSSSTKVLQPIIQIDDLFKKESPGPMWLRLYNLYHDVINEHCNQLISCSG